jgi:peptidoglycan/xylan/chitin deacetylase (PgdA/CDA1 family)
VKSSVFFGAASLALAVSIPNHSVLAAGKPHKPPRPAPKPVATVKPAAPPKPAQPKPSAYELLLTFDDGPRVDTTPKVLDTLDQYGIKTVFFVNGVRFMGKGAQNEKAKELMREAQKRGHIVGNHTVHHYFLCGKRGPVVGEREILDNAQLIQDATGVAPPLFRTPFGSHCASLTATLHKLGIRPIGWDIDPQDWKLQDAEKILAVMKDELSRVRRARSIVLFHDVQPATVEMLPKLLKWIADENEVRKAKGEPPFKYVDGKYLMSAPPQQLGQVGSRAALTAPGAPTDATPAAAPAASPTPALPAPVAPIPAK